MSISQVALQRSTIHIFLHVDRIIQLIEIISQKTVRVVRVKTRLVLDKQLPLKLVV